METTHNTDAGSYNMRIKDNNGNYWNADNDCFTTAQYAATTYESASDLPLYVGDMERDIHADDDIRYYAYGSDEADAAVEFAN